MKTHDPCGIIADLLASTVLHAFESYAKTYLYVWELDGCQFLLSRLDAGTYSGTAWTADFVRLNADKIRRGDSQDMDFNLRAAREKKEAT